jgi:DNA-directed RNA polymerase subunit RPC12/RpoP
MMQCPRCSSTHIRKNGTQRGKQNYICVDCQRQFIDKYEPKGYSDEVKQECLKMYTNGMGFRAIERVKGVHHTSATPGEAIAPFIEPSPINERYELLILLLVFALRRVTSH